MSYSAKLWNNELIDIDKYEHCLNTIPNFKKYNRIICIKCNNDLFYKKSHVFKYDKDNKPIVRKAHFSHHQTYKCMS